MAPQYSTNIIKDTIRIRNITTSNNDEWVGNIGSILQGLLISYLLFHKKYTV